jgi:methylthioribose-1-phosphate isomerase
MSSVLEAIRYKNAPNPTLDILDQLQLPHKTQYLSITSAENGWAAIKAMSTRGAPAIAIVAALSLAVELANNPSLPSSSPENVRDYIQQKLKYLVTSRPTAVNLEDAARKLNAVVSSAASETGSTAESVIKAYIVVAEAMLAKDVQDNEAIGANGAHWLIHNVPNSENRKLNVITHCNTGYVTGQLLSYHVDSDEPALWRQPDMGQR